MRENNSFLLISIYCMLRGFYYYLKKENYFVVKNDLWIFIFFVLIIFNKLYLELEVINWNIYLF